MRDTLDLVEIARQGMTYRHNARRRVVRTVIGVVAVIGVVLLTRAAIAAPLGGVYTLHDSAWQEFNAPITGAPYRIAISPRGTVWIASAVYGGLYRYDASGWTSFGPDDFGLSIDSVDNLALNGEELWATVPDSEAVIHFDGKRWTAYPHAVRKAPATGIVAGAFGVFVADVDGFVTQFDGRQWISNQTRNLLPGVVDSTSISYPTLLK